MQLRTIDGIDPTSLVPAVGAQTYSRGAGSARQRAVLHMEWDGVDSLLQAVVRGSSGNAYLAASLLGNSSSDSPELVFAFGECTCPIGINCKHVVASSGHRHVRGRSRRGGPKRAAGSVVGAEPGRAACTNSGRTHRNRLTTFRWPSNSPSPVPPAPRGAARRNRRRSRRASIRLVCGPGSHRVQVDGPMSWSRLGTSYYFSGSPRLAVQLLQELYALHTSRSGASSYYSNRDDKTIDLAAFDSRRLWPLLDEAAEIGLQLVRARKRLRAGRAVRPGRAVPGHPRAGDDPGSLTIAPVLQIDGRSGENRGDTVPVLLIGAQGHGVVLVSRTQAQRVRLDRLEPAAREAHHAGGAVAAADGPGQPAPAGPGSATLPVPRRVLSTAAPTRGGHKVRRSFAPPAISEPTLVLRATFGDDHDLALTWEWAYEVGDAKKRLPLASGADEDFRNPAGEQAVLDTLDAPLERFGMRGEGPGA